MARSRFRSQPALQRSGGRASTTVLGLCLVVLTAAGAGAVVSMAIRGLDDWANRPEAVARIERLTPVVPAAPSPPAQAAPATPQLAETVAPPMLVTETARPRAAAERGPKPAKALKPLLPELGAPEQRWERQQQDYQQARDAYDANERAEGYRWAQQNKVRTRRYCRGLEQQRTTAFMEGCLTYAAGAKPREAAGTSQGDPG